MAVVLAALSAAAVLLVLVDPAIAQVTTIEGCARAIHYVPVTGDMIRRGRGAGGQQE